jgi:ABC-type antimicrobial peptide transport system permease subunit
VGDVAKNYQAIKNELLSTGVIQNVALSDHTTIYGGNNTDGLVWDDKAPGAKILISVRYVTPEFMKTTGLKILEGRDFETTDSAFSSKGINVIITQSFEKLMGTGSAIGKKIHNDGDTTMATVVGVINDYVYGYMYGSPDPVAFVCTAPKNTSVMYLRLNQQGDTRSSLATIGSIFKKYNPAYPFNYIFVDDQFNSLFLSEALISRLSRVFAALAIIISCLGLFGLAIYMAERRTKEIGVRKVLGASVPGIASLLSKDFLKLVLISCLVAFPIAWWAMYKWLLGYPYRVHISWWVFLAAGLTAMVIAIITISFQSVKAAIANPVKSLRTE